MLKLPVAFRCGHKYIAQKNLSKTKKTSIILKKCIEIKSKKSIIKRNFRNISGEKKI